MGRDTVFREHHPEIAEFTFNENVASVFADMLKRSVPGYGTILSFMSLFGSRFAQDNSNIYDLGCSLGASSFALAQNVDKKNCRVKAYDTSRPMINRFRKLLEENPLHIPVDIYEEDITEIDFERASVTVLNLTLQFVEPEKRLALLRKIADATLPGGVIILAEKMSDESENGIMTDLYYDFKRANSYSEMEISQKRNALENYLITDTEETHFERLKAAGFKGTLRWFQTLNFRAYIAWK